jgi:hypothetical protein
VTKGEAAVDTCPRTGKIPQSYTDAVNAMEHLRPTDPRQDLLEVYPCPRHASPDTAEHWHVGHRDVGGRTRRWHPKLPDPAPLTQRLDLPPHLRALAEDGAA